METNTLEIQVQRMYRFESDRPLKAFADIIVNDALLIKGIKVLEGKNGLFVSMPQDQAKDKKWYDSVRCLTHRRYRINYCIAAHNSKRAATPRILRRRTNLVHSHR